MKKTFIFYSDWIDYTEEMSLEEKWLFLQTILDYQHWKELPDLWSIKFIWSRVKKQLDEDNTKWSEEIEKRRMAWIEGNKKRWGNRTSSQVIASATNYSQVIADNDNDNDSSINNTETKKTIKKEYIKSIDELRAFHSTLEDKPLNKEVWTILKYMLELWYEIEKKEKALKEFAKRCKESAIRYIWMTQSGDIPYWALEWVAFKWHTRHTEKQSKIWNYKNSLITFLDNKK